MEALRSGDPQRVGRYDLVARLGAGGMGVVYLGRSPAGRAVAVKVIRDRFAGDDGFVARFRREVSAARLVTGAFTAPLLDADTGADGPWLVTAYLPGVSLREAVQAGGALPHEAARTLAAGLVEALVDIHRAGVVHRDLKPGNIMLTGDGPRVIDFGIARPEDATAITRLGAVLGSPGYMSPEQIAGEVVGPASDMFSLGAVLVFGATGREPFRAGSTDEVLRRVARAEVDLGDVTDPELRELVASCLRVDPAHRPSAVELLDRLPQDATREQVLPAPLAALVDHRAERAKQLTGGEPAPVYDGDETLDPAEDSHAARALTEPGTTAPHAVAPRLLSRRRLAVIGGGIAVAGGAAILGLSLGEPAVRGAPGPATTSRAAPTSGLTSVWRARLGTSATDLIMAGGVLLVCGRREAGIRAIEPRTGRLLWSRDEETVEATAGGLAFLVNPKGWRLTAVHVRTGVEKWAYTPDTGFRSRPVAVVGSVVWCCTGVMVALDLATGRPLRQVGAYNLDLVTTNGRLVAVWTDRIGGHDPNTGDHTWTVSVDEPLDARAGNGLVFYRDATGTLHAMRTATGAAAWQRPDIGGALVYGFQVGDDTAYCNADGEVIAMTAATGRPRWSVRLGRNTGSDDVLGLVDTTLYAAHVDGTLSAVDAASGRIRWTHRTTGRVVACPVGVGGRVFLADDDGYVEAISPPKGR